MDLEKFVKERKQELAAWVPFADFEIKLPYVDRPTMSRLLDGCRKRGFDPRSHQRTEELDNEAYRRRMAGLILDWRGLTLGKLAGLINIDISGEDPDQVVPCTDKHKQILADHAYGVANFISETVMDLQAFREQALEDEKKTSGPLCGSSSCSDETPAESAAEQSETG